MAPEKNITLRPENVSDADAITILIQDAFAPMAYSNGTEAAIISALRAAGHLTLSLVAEHKDASIVGHIAFSPVTINGMHNDWFGLGPVSVKLEHQRNGIGSALIQEGLKRIKQDGAKGCVLIGNPNYYSRFGFTGDSGLTYGSLDTAYVQQLNFSNAPRKQGTLKYCDAFEKAASSA